MAPFTPLVRPRRYFGRTDRPSLAIATAAVLALSVATAGVVLWVVPPLVELLPIPPDIRSGTIPVMKESVRSEAPLAVALTIASWILYAVLLWLFVRVVTDGGEFVAPLGVVGEATLAVVAVFPLKLLALWYFVTTTSDPIANASLGITTVLWGTPLLLVLSIPGLGWKIGVVVGGLVAVHDIGWRRATAAAAVFGAITSPLVTPVAYYAVHIHLL